MYGCLFRSIFMIFQHLRKFLNRPRMLKIYIFKHEKKIFMSFDTFHGFSMHICNFDHQYCVGCSSQPIRARYTNLLPYKIHDPNIYLQKKL